MDGPASGAWNMAVDEAILGAVAEGRAPLTLRFYRWRPACLSLGYFQAAAVVDAKACEERGVDVVRRPTGGRAILHGDELTYSVTLPLSALGRSLTVSASYQRLSQALLEGLRTAGFPVTVAVATAARARPGPACFDEPATHELLLHGKKVVGSAQVRRFGAVLQHGSILVSPQVAETLACLSVPVGTADDLARSMEASVGGLNQVIKADPAAIACETARAFERLFGVRFQPGALSRNERETAVEVSSRRYGPFAWMDGGPVAAEGQNTTRTR